MRHYFLNLDGLKVFIRESGAETAPVLLTPHGYPCSSYQFRNLGPLLAEQRSGVAPFSVRLGVATANVANAEPLNTLVARASDSSLDT